MRLFLAMKATHACICMPGTTLSMLAALQGAAAGGSPDQAAAQDTGFSAAIHTKLRGSQGGCAGVVGCARGAVRALRPHLLSVKHDQQPAQLWGQ